VLLSTLSIDAFSNATYTGGSTVGDSPTLSEKTVQILFGRLARRTFTDPVEVINVTGAGASHCTGTGTHSVTCLSFVGVGSVVVNMQASNDLVNVQSIDVATTVNPSGLGTNTVNLGDPVFGVQHILGPVTVTAGPGVKTTLTVDDGADGGAKSNVVLSGTALTGLAPASILFPAGVASLTVTGGSGNDTYTVTGTGAPTTLNTGSGSNQTTVQATTAPLTIQGHGGADQVNVSGNGNDLTAIQGSVTVRNTTASTTLNIDDQNNYSPPSSPVSLSDTSLAGLAPAPILYQASGLSTSGPDAGLSVALPLLYAKQPLTVTNTPPVTSLVLGGVSNTVDVEGLTGELTIFNIYNAQATIVAGSNPSGTGGTLANLNGVLREIDGTFATDNFTLDDGADTTPRTVTQVMKVIGGIQYDLITGLTPKATFELAAGLGPGGLTINGGSGGNTFNLGADSFFPNITVNGGKGGDTFNVTDMGSGSYTLNTSTGPNHVNIPNASIGNGSPINVVGHGGADTVTIGSLAPALGGTLTNREPVTVSNTTNSTALIVDDSADTVAQTVTIGPNSVQYPGIGTPIPRTITFLSGVKSVDVFGGSNATYDISSPGPTTPVTIHGGAGTNTLVGGNLPNVWNITGTDAGNVGSVTFQSIRNLVGGSDLNTFRFGNGDGVTGVISGGFGFSVLDYSAYATQVSVDLGAHKAKGVGAGVFNIRGVIGGLAFNNLTSGPAGAVLIGGPGGNSLLGVGGRDMLIAGPGPGSSLLRAGLGETILIGGTTGWDKNVAALRFLMAVWSQPAVPYGTRVLELLGGPVPLNTATVHSNHVRDTLVTNLAGGLDFVFFDAFDLPLPNPKRPGEVYVFIN
jgi:acrosin